MNIRVSFLLPASLLFAAISLHATSLAPACIAHTLSFYEGINSDSACSVGILDFDSFTFAPPTSTGGAVPLTDLQIELTPCNGVNSDLPGACSHDSTSLSGGFSISAVDPLHPFSVGPGQTETYTIDWRFVIDTGPIDEGASLGLDPVFGGVNVTQTYCVDSSLSPTPCTNALGTVTPQTISVDTTNPFNSVTFGTPALRFAEVQTVITLTGGSTTGAGFDAVTGTGTIVDTPEPAAFLLVASGLLLLGGLRKRA